MVLFSAGQGLSTAKEEHRDFKIGNLNLHTPFWPIFIF